MNKIQNKENPAVIFLSAEHITGRVNDTEHDYKHDIILHDNNTKGAVDLTDKLINQRILYQSKENQAVANRNFCPYIGYYGYQLL